MKEIGLTINGIERKVTCTPDNVLLDLLREDLELTGAKQSCDRKGQCGACTVIVDGKAVRSCLQKVERLDGADIITVEGLGTPENPHLIQEAFVLAGAVQCGFCTPGMIMAAKGLLDKNTEPSIEEIKKAFAHNLCRCTGYTKIIDAVQLAARFIRGENTPDKVRGAIGPGMIGESHPRHSAMLRERFDAYSNCRVHVGDSLGKGAVIYTRHRQDRRNGAVRRKPDDLHGRGGALLNALDKLKALFRESGLKTYSELKKAGKPTRFEGTKAVPGGELDPATGQGPGYDSHFRSFLCNIGVNFEGLSEGGMDQGASYALREEYVHGKSNDWKTFKFPTMQQSFEVEYVNLQETRIRGPLGATGIGEMTMTSTAPQNLCSKSIGFNLSCEFVFLRAPW